MADSMQLPLACCGALAWAARTCLPQPEGGEEIRLQKAVGVRADPKLPAGKGKQLAMGLVGQGAKERKPPLKSTGLEGAQNFTHERRGWGHHGALSQR